MAFVFAVIRRSRSAGSALTVRGSMSTNTGVSRFHRTALTVELKVNDWTRHSLPGGAPSAAIDSTRPMSQLTTERTQGLPR